MRKEEMLFRKLRVKQTKGKNPLPGNFCRNKVVPRKIRPLAEGLFLLSISNNTIIYKEGCEKMKTIVSGIQSSGDLTLGNYLGAIKNFVKMQNALDPKETRYLYFIADLHAITVYQEPAKLKENIRKVAAIYLAAGLDPEKVILFIQSEVHEHAELGYLLETIAYIGELERMTQFKDKMAKQEKGVSSALLTYPVLMAADILLYNADIVPVGEDQKQHLELARNLAERFNNRYGETFTIPEPQIAATGAKIMSLQEPTKKMSKSDPITKSSVFLLDPPNVIKKKISSAVTDSEAQIAFDPEKKPGVSNLLTILSCLTEKPIPELVSQMQGLGYGELKKRVAEAVIQELEPLQTRFAQIYNSPELDEILTQGKEKASKIACEQLAKVKKALGLLR
jgi:tryptophanyl-tRNA synthetase